MASTFVFASLREQARDMAARIYERGARAATFKGAGTDGGLDIEQVRFNNMLRDELARIESEDRENDRP